MNFWQFLDATIDRFPGWPSERQWVTIWLGSLIVLLLYMAAQNPKLWEVEVFKVIAQAVVLTGFLNMVLAFHFAANKSDETRAAVDAVRADNTGKALDTNAKAIDALAAGAASPENGAADGARRTAAAATDMAEEIADRGGAAPEPD